MNKQKSMTIDQMRSRVNQRLTKVCGRMRRQLILEGVAKFVLLAAGLAIFTFVVDWKFELSRTARFLLVGVAFLGFVWLTVRAILIPAFTRWGTMDVAGAIDNSGFPSVDQAISPKVASLLEAPETSQPASEYSHDLAYEAARQNFHALEKIDIEQRLNQRHRRNSWLGLATAIVVPLLFVALLPTGLSKTWFGRWVHLSDVPWPRNTQIEVLGLQDGKLVVPRGEPTDLLVQVTDKRNVQPDRIRLELRFLDRKPQRLTVIRDGAGKFKHELTGMRDVAKLRIWAGDARQGPVEIIPVDRPKLVDVRLKHQHPWDNQPQIHDFDRGDGAISLLPKTGAQLILKSNVKVKNLQAEWNLSEPPELERIGEQEFLARWEHVKDAQLRVQLVGTESGLLSPHRLVSIGLKRDRPPSMNMRPNGVRRRVTPTATIPLELTARDDFGISGITFAANFEKTKEIDPSQIQDAAPEANQSSSNAAEASQLELFGPIDRSTERLLDLIHRYQLTSLSLNPGDLIRLRTTATDSCHTGNQSTKTPWLTFSIVKPQELFREILARQQQLRSRLRKATDRAIDLKDAITTAQFPEEGRPLIREHRMIQRDVATVHRGLADSVLEMELNELGGPEAIELIDKNVLRPLQQLTEQVMNDQRSALETLSRGGNGSQAEAIDRQGEIVQTLKAVLKNMAQWDSFVDVVNQLDTVIKLQGNLRNSTEELRKKDLESVFD